MKKLKNRKNNVYKKNKNILLKVGRKSKYLLKLVGS